MNDQVPSLPQPLPRLLLQCGMIRSRRRIRSARSEPLQAGDSPLRGPRRLLEGILERMLLQHGLDQDQRIQLGDARDDVVQLLVRHLDEATVLLLRGHRVVVVGRHPLVCLDLVQCDPLVRVFLQHPQDEILQFGTVLSVRWREVDRIVLDLLV